MSQGLGEQELEEPGAPSGVGRAGPGDRPRGVMRGFLPHTLVYMQMETSEITFISESNFVSHIYSSQNVMGHTGKPREDTKPARGPQREPRHVQVLRPRFPAHRRAAAKAAVLQKHIRLPDTGQAPRRL